MLLLALIGCLVGIALAQCPSERDVLTELYYATDGDMWTKSTNWLSDVDICDWTGVQCKRGFVQVLNMQDFGMYGTIPDTISCLTSLQTVTLNDNDIEGFPTALCGATELKSLNLGNNLLSGEIPTCVDQMEYIRVFDVVSNLLSGSVPVEFLELEFLQTLSVQCNADIDCDLPPHDFNYNCGTLGYDCTTPIPPDDDDIIECDPCVEVEECGTYCAVDDDGNLVDPPIGSAAPFHCLSDCESVCLSLCPLMCECQGVGCLCVDQCEDACLGRCVELCAQP
ncbi:hypothetical protein KIPB_003391 [Kipferlia bialata]|uniref:Leucine-rich repeat-containing N-terminal plant-type domain-containing protein n=1 Tax=Kipferlia bialata TaxID=797122 RepID=A0A9K3CS39_9EUKA|nr:hypothetical protein KIPB_003391 [Kipferlia bialata]|eukprot:g3391.t1